MQWLEVGLHWQGWSWLQVHVYDFNYHRTVGCRPAMPCIACVYFMTSINGPRLLPGLSRPADERPPGAMDLGYGCNQVFIDLFKNDGEGLAEPQWW